MAYGLADIWPMVDEHHEVAWSQVAAWRFMAELCNDQADALERAIAQLGAYWPATPGSAAAPFAEIVHGLIASMRDSDSAAASTGPALIEILTALGLARNSVAQLVEAHDRYEGAEQAHLAYLKLMPGQVPATPTPYVPAPPEHWRAHLDDLARSVMVETDAQVAAATQRLKPPPPYHGIDVVLPSSPQRSGIGVGGGAPLTRPDTFVDPGPHMPDTSGLDVPGGPAVNSRPAAAPSGVHDPSTPDPAVGDRFTTSVVQLAESPLARRDAITGAGPPVRSTDGRSIAPARPAPTDGVEPWQFPEAIGGNAEVERPAMSAVLPPTAARPAQGSQRPATRPGGRAALWTSQRRRKASDRTDAWSVERGAPPVIEAPDPPEHDPGPGVIGMGR